jgi:hypothetical protein
MTLEEAVESSAFSVTTAEAVSVEVTNPEHPFGGVILRMPSEAPVIVTLQSPAGAGGGGGAAPTPPVTGAVDSVFGRKGDVVAVDGDYTLDKIDPPVAAWILPGKVRVKADGSLQLWNPDQTKWHSISVGGAAGGEYLLIGAGET